MNLISLVLNAQATLLLKVLHLARGKLVFDVVHAHIDGQVWVRIEQACECIE